MQMQIEVFLSLDLVIDYFSDTIVEYGLAQSRYEGEPQVF